MGAKVKAWGAAGIHGQTKLYFYEGNLDAEGYMALLTRALPEIRRLMRGVPDWTFQHDGASAHKDRRTNAWLAAHVPNHITSGPAGEWPGCSPDLNWIEDLNGILEAKLEEFDEAPNGINALKARAQRCWGSVPKSTLAACIRSMPGRLQTVIETKGAALRH